MKKVSYILPYKEAKFSKLRYFLIIIIKCFFSFYYIFFNTQSVCFFIFCEIFVTFTTILSLFFLFFFRMILIFFTSFFFLVFIYFLDNIQLIMFYKILYIRKKIILTKMIKRIYEKIDLLEDLRLSLLNFSLAMIYIIHKILVLLKNHLNFLLL